MILSVTNPIYDAPFKYLMEDERIAKTILSALLKKNVVQVEMRPHEYTNKNKDYQVAMFRVDFAATVREEDANGNAKDHHVLVELQKTWIETETLRFRRYLGTHYSDENNMKVEGKKGKYALPMVAVYLLGHRVGNIEAPIFYCNHKVLDYEGNEVTEGIPDPFVESLTHDSIIVQIPLLHELVNGRLKKVLSVFDQTFTDPSDKQLIQLNEDDYQGDKDMEYILRKLTSATVDAELRKDMDVEDEYYSLLESRDTTIMSMDRRIKQQISQLDEQKTQLDEQKTQLDEQKTQLDEQKTQLDEQKTQLDEQKTQLDEQKTQLDEQKTQLDEQKTQLDEQRQQLANFARAMASSGMDESQIAKATGLDLSVIHTLLL